MKFCSAETTLQHTVQSIQFMTLLQKQMKKKVHVEFIRNNGDVTNCILKCLKCFFAHYKMLFSSLTCVRGRLHWNKVTESVELKYNMIQYTSIVKDVTFSEPQKIVPMKKRVSRSIYLGPGFGTYNFLP